MAGGEVNGAGFTADVKLDGINPYVEVPPEVVAAVGGDRAAAVLVELRPADTESADAGDTVARDAGRLRAIGRLSSDGRFRTSLVPRRSAPTRLYLDRWMRDSAGVDVGDPVEIVLALDGDPPVLTVPDVLVAALARDPSARAGWNQLPDSRRREILRYLNFLRALAARERVVRKTLDRLAGRNRLA